MAHKSVVENLECMSMLSLGEIASAAETWWRAGTGHLHKAGAHVRPILVSPDNSVVYFTVNVRVLCTVGHI